MEFIKASKFWIVLQSLALAAVIGAWVWDVGRVSAAAAASAETATLQQELQQRLVEATALPATRQEVERMKTRLGMLSDRVPGASERNETIKTLFDLLSGVRGVQVLEVTAPTEKTGPEGLVHVSREASFRGNFADLGRLVDKVEGLGFVVGVTSLQLQRDPEDPKLLNLTLRFAIPFQK